VFKPDDFYAYYGVKGLGSFSAGSSIGNGTVGGNTLGLGATGTPIYWGGFNTKTKTLQGGLNKVLNSKGYQEIGVDGKLGPMTCAALGLMYGKFPSAVKSQVNQEILQEAAAICNKVQREHSSIKSKVVAYVQELERNRDTTPAKVLDPQTEIVPADTSPKIKTPPPDQQIPQGTAKPIPVEIEDNPPLQPITFEEMEVTAAAPKKSYGSMGLLVGLAVAGGAAYYFMKKKG
jgi:hypothetical protein